MNQPQTQSDDDFARRSAALRASWPTGERLRVEELLGRTPGFQPTEAQLLELLYEEFLARRQAGEQPAPAEYLARFPAHRAALERLFALHAELGDELNSQQALTRLGLDGRTVEFSHEEPAAERTGAFGPPRAKKPREGDLVRYLGDYELLREIARGGMGVVYQARQVALKRVVALKMILSGDFASAAEVRRFHTEAESAAQLDHPHIVPIYEVGEHEGLHYFSMGYVDGPPLSSRLADGPLPPREAAALVRTVCQAVHYAHTQGVIHRDLKPGNILLDRDGQPRVTDFGLAKRSQGDSSLTGTGHIVGTPSYMPPEQASGRNELTREPADVYALGAVLYATLTGRPPFQADNPLDTLRQVLEREPVAPRQLNPAVPLDLETICLKCLEKSIPRRYASALAVADELERFLEGKPILARPIGRPARAWRWCKRNPVVASLLTAVAASLVIGATVSTFFAVKATRLAGREQTARVLAEEKTRLASRESANLALNQAQSLCDTNEANVGLLWMVRAHEMALQAEDADLADACRAMVSSWLGHVPKLERVVATLPGNPTARYGPRDETILVAASILPPPGQAGLLEIDARTGEVLRQLPDVCSPGYQLAVSPDRTRLLLKDAQERVRLWSLTEWDWTGQELPPGTGYRAEFSPRGELLATATSEGQIEFWNALDGQPTGIRIEQPQPELDIRHFCIAFSAKGEQLWTGGLDRLLRRWDVATGSEIGRPIQLKGMLYAPVASPRGDRVALAAGGGINLYATDAAFTQVAAEFEGALSPREMAYSPGGELLVEAGYNNLLRFRDGRTGKTMSSAARSSNGLLSCRVHGAADRVLAAGHSGQVEEWLVPAVTFVARWRATAPWPESAVVFRQDRRSVWRQGSDGFPLLVESLTTLPNEAALPEGVAEVLPAPDGTKLYCRTLTGQLAAAVWQTGQVRVSTHRHLPAPLYFTISPRGDRLWTLNEETVQLWDAATVAPLGEPLAFPTTLRDLSFAQQGDLAGLYDPAEGRLHFLSGEDGTSVEPPLELGRDAGQVTLTPDGVTVLVCRGGTIEFWDRVGRTRRHAVVAHDAPINFAALSPEGTRLATVGFDEVVRVYDVATQESSGTARRGAGKDAVLAFSPDGRLLASQGHASPLRLWHVATGRALGPSLDFKHNRASSALTPPNAGHRSQGGVPFAFSAASDRVLSLTTTAAYDLPDVPLDQAQLKLFVETWTGLTLEENDVRVLPRDEWQRRRRQLLDSGWQEAPRVPPPGSQDVRPVDLRTAAPVATWPAHPGARLWKVVFSPDGTRLATSTTNSGGWKLWDAATREVVWSFAEPYAALDGLSFTADGRRLVAGHRKGLAWWNLETGAEEHHVLLDNYVSGVAIAPDQSVVAAMVRESRRVLLFDLATATPGRTLEIPMPDPVPGSRSVSQACFSPDGSLLIAACGGRGWPDYIGADAVIAIWETRTWKLLAGFPANQNDVLDLAISPDSQWLATADGRLRTTKLWNLADLLARTDQTPLPDAPPTRVLQSTHAQTSVAFSPDGVWLVAGGETSSRGCVTLHRLAEDQTFIAPIESGALAVAFSPDGSQLATTSAEGTVSLWNFRDLVGE